MEGQFGDQTSKRNLPVMNIQPRDIDALIELFESSDWDELHLKTKELELYLSTDPAARSSGAGVVHPPASTAAPEHASPAVAIERRGASTVSVPTHWVAVKAPNLGTFYRAAKPGAAPFVEVGQEVEPETELCLIEVMKLFTTLKAGVRGVVREVCVQDAAMVEFGDTLFYIEPA